MKLIAGEEVILSEYRNEIGGVEAEYGTAYYTAEGDFVGVLGHTVGAYGVSTGIFKEVKGTSPLCEAAELLGEE